ncbi:Ribonuclease 2 [Zea mays]|uniref:Ribonuclease 2 n=1 Tax=Zea mays TaxID=4577 RepID=A0A1D6N4Q0_MAIZE|nr:Ribonuclease 2 [Zea mays]
METRRPRRGWNKRFVLPLALLCLAVLLPGALLPPSASASSSSPAAGGGSRKRRWVGFDYYVLALQWPGTICRETSNCCDTNGCCRYRLAYHSLSSGSRFVSPLKSISFFTHLDAALDELYTILHWMNCIRYCTGCTVYDTALNASFMTYEFVRFKNDLRILMLMPILEKYWPSLYCGSSSTCFGGRGPFWVHEDEYDYFSTALYLYSKYNVTKALRKARIRPTSGRKYAVGHIVAVIEYAFGAMPSLVCKNGSVQELRLCFHKDYQPRDCTLEAGSAPNGRSYCPRYITFPSYKPSGEFLFSITAVWWPILRRGSTTNPMARFRATCVRLTLSSVQDSRFCGPLPSRVCIKYQ